MIFKYLLLLIFILISNPSTAKVVIQSQIDNGPWAKVTAIYPLKGQTVTLKVVQVPKATIRWYQIIPDISKIYKNANHPWEKNPYQWVGFGAIDYERQELTAFRNQWKIQPFKIPLKKNTRFSQTKIGSFWFQVEIEKKGRIQKSAGLEHSDKRGLSPKVFRVSIREDNNFLGYLTTFFNVPAIFGSTTYQSYHYIGVDCADVLVAAYHRWKGLKLKKNYNVAMLVNKLRKIKTLKIVNGRPHQLLTWEKDIHSGDFIAVRYQGARQYQHIGALAQDANHNGLLDGDDLVLHAGPLPLQYSYLKEGYFDGSVAILRAQGQF